ncbi:MAG: hypothetical protein ACR2HJ_07735 [Fimbriimonadales bacterium]
MGSFFGNFVVQILVGVGLMVFLITLAETFKASALRKTNKLSKEEEFKIKGDMQKEIMALREEVDALKSTLLEHSMSLQSNVDGIKHRLERVETRSQELRR